MFLDASGSDLVVMPSIFLSESLLPFETGGRLHGLNSRFDIANLFGGARRSDIPSSCATKVVAPGTKERMRFAHHQPASLTTKFRGCWRST